MQDSSGHLTCTRVYSLLCRTYDKYIALRRKGTILLHIYIICFDLHKVLQAHYNVTHAFLT